MDFFFSRIFPWPFILVGVGCLYFGVQGLVRSNESTDWPHVNGTIISSKVAQHTDDEGSTTYHAEILYDYSINGVTYSGNRVAYGDYGSSNSAHARTIVNRYPKGKQVAAYYMPKDLKECLLEPGMKFQAWFLPVFGLIFFCVGNVMLIFLPKAMRKRSSSS